LGFTKRVYDVSLRKSSRYLGSDGRCSTAAPQCFGVTREFRANVSLAFGGSLELNNVNGTVRIEAWDKDVVEVRAVKTTTEKESNLDRVSIDVDSRRRGFPFPRATRRKRAWKWRWTIRCTCRGAAQVTHVNTVNGSLRVTDLDSVVICVPSMQY